MLTSSVTDNINQAVSNTAYTYDKVGNRTKVVTNDTITDFAYNELNQVKTAVVYGKDDNVVESQITYTYDLSGNQMKGGDNVSFKDTLSKKQMKMKKVIITILLIVSVLGTNTYGVENVYGRMEDSTYTTSKKHIKVEVVSASKKQIKLKVSNTGDENFWTSGSFVLKKRKNGKWKKVEKKEGVLFPKTVVVEAGKSIIVKFKWKKCFGKKLSKGKYKIKFVRSKTFKIK